MISMDDEGEKSPQCYNFSGIRVFLKKYKSKRQHHDHHHCKNINNNVPNQKNKISKHSNQSHDDHNHILKVTNASKTDSKNHMKGMKKVRQNKNNGLEKEENNSNSNNIVNRLLRVIMTFLDPSKKKKKLVSSKIQSASQSPSSTFHTCPSDRHSLDSNFLSEDSGRSTSMKSSSTSEEAREDVCTSLPSAKSKRRWFEEKSNHGSFKNNSFGRTISKRSQVIMFSSSSGPLKPPTIELKLDCTLEEQCHGCVKNIKVNRDVFTCTGQRTKREEVLAVNIEPGWISGTKITFQTTKEDINAGEFPADIIFTIIEKHHSLFRRVEDDLELEIEIPLSDALTGCPLTIPLLGKDNKMSMELDQVVYPGYEVTISGQGMPKQKSPQDRGDLKIKFLVNFPQELTDEQREKVYTILKG